MKTALRFLLAAGIALALAFTFNACSSSSNNGDDTPSSSSSGGATPSSGSGPQFGTCDELFGVMFMCIFQVLGDPKNASISQEYTDCFASLEFDDDGEICDDILEPLEPMFEQCILESGLCGNASLEECNEYLDIECDDDWESEAAAPNVFRKKLLKR